MIDGRPMRYNLSQGLNMSRFLAAVEIIESVNPASLSDYEREFFTSIKDKFADRQQFNSDWSPTMNQWMFLAKLAQELHQ